MLLIQKCTVFTVPKLLQRERERVSINIKEYNEYMLVNTLVLLNCRLFFRSVLGLSKHLFFKLNVKACPMLEQTFSTEIFVYST